MKMRLMTCALGALLAVGCSGSSNGSSSTSTTGDNGSGNNAASSGSSGSKGSVSGSNGSAGSVGGSMSTSTTASGSTSGSTGTSSGACPSAGPATIADLRNPNCLASSNADGGWYIQNINGTILYTEPTGGPLADGGKGTPYSASYVLVDNTGLGVALFHDKSSVYPKMDPVTGQYVSIAGYYGSYPVTGGEIQISDIHFYDAGTGPALPSPSVASLAQVAQTTQGVVGGAAGVLSDLSMVGHYVTIPAGPYTQNNTEPAFVYKTYQDGISLTASNGSKILVNLYTEEYSNTAGTALCYPTADGGIPDLSAGGFNGFLDLTSTDDTATNYVVFLGNCGM